MSRALCHQADKVAIVVRKIFCSDLCGGEINRSPYLSRTHKGADM